MGGGCLLPTWCAICGNCVHGCHSIFSCWTACNSEKWEAICTWTARHATCAVPVVASRVCRRMANECQSCVARLRAMQCASCELIMLSLWPRAVSLWLCSAIGLNCMPVFVAHFFVNFFGESSQPSQHHLQRNLVSSSAHEVITNQCCKECTPVFVAFLKLACCQGHQVC